MMETSWLERSEAIMSELFVRSAAMSMLRHTLFHWALKAAARQQSREIPPRSQRSAPSRAHFATVENKIDGIGKRSAFIRPLIPALRQREPKGDGWLHEPEWDGSLGASKSGVALPPITL